VELIVFDWYAPVIYAVQRIPSCYLDCAYSHGLHAETDKVIHVFPCPGVRVVCALRDGTVVDSIGHITTSWRLAFSEFYYQALREQNSRDMGPPPVPSETWIKQCIGLSVDSTINKYLPNASTWERHVITEAYRKHFRAGAGNTAYLPGAEAGLRQLLQLGYTLAVATGKSRRGLDFELELLGTEGLFLTTRTADCTKSKPHPQMLLEIIDDADSVASRTLMVGDSCVDMRMAERAGNCVPSL
jgi:phosphoglycolate phosphatase